MALINWVTTPKDKSIPEVKTTDDTRTKYIEIDDKTYEFFDNSEARGLCVRDGQLYMASSIVNSLSEGESIIIEAGVGIGKSYAYLVPLLYLKDLLGEKIILSTSTIALQEQLKGDVDKVSEMLGISTSCVIAKGQTNFLCTKKAMDYMERNPKEYIDLSRQDRKENDEPSDKIWNQVCVNRCSFARCDHRFDCEFYDMRNQMKYASVVICNHNLLAKDFEKDRSLLNRAEIIVCDEAHNLEEKFKDNYTKTFDGKSFKNLLVTALSMSRREDLYDAIMDLMNNLEIEIKKMGTKAVERLKEKDIDIIDCDELEFEFTQEFKAIVSELLDYIEDLIITISSIDTPGADELSDSLIDVQSEFEYLSSYDSNIYWMRKYRNNYTINYVSKKISDIIRRTISESSARFILTSATLSTEENDYSYILKGIGMDESEITVEESQKSPYDYENNSMMYLCEDLPNPHQKEAYLDALYKKIIELIRLTKGKTLVLFTSKYDMNYVYNKIKSEFDDINIFIQNNSSSQEEIKNRFKEDTNSVLLSTGTFWEGIDIKGESLSSVIIARLPFPIVTPYLEYKKSTYETPEIGHEEVYVKEMLIKLKQGIGRLIRCESDKGIISILDSRVANKKYREKIDRTINHPNVTTDMKELERFVESVVLEEPYTLRKHN